MIRGRIALTAIAALGALGLTACGSSSGGGTSTGGSAAKPAAKHLTVAYFEEIQASTFVQQELAGMKKVADANNVTIEPFDGNLNPQQQTSQIQNANATGRFQGYLVGAVSNAVLPQVRAAMDKGVRIVTVNFPLGPDAGSGAAQVPGQVAAVMTAPQTDGANIGKLIVQACAGKASCKVALTVGANAVPSEQAKIKAIKQQIATVPGIKLVGAITEAGFTRDGGIRAAQNVLQANPDVDVYATTGDNMSLGVAQVLKQLGKTNVKVIGGAASQPGVAAVKSGAWFGTSTKLPYTEGQLAMEALLKALRGDATAGQSIDPVDSAAGKAIGPVVTRESLAKDPSFTGEWAG